MNEVEYFPNKPNSRYNYLKAISYLIIFLLIVHQLPPILRRNHNSSENDWTLEIVVVIIGILYFGLQKLTTKVVFDSEKRNLQISYVTLLKSDNKLNIDFENLKFEFKNRQVRSTSDWTLYIYDSKNLKHKISTVKDNFTKENLKKMAQENFD